MKEVYVLRHANWDGKEDTLTEQGRREAKEYATRLPDFSFVYSSPFVRARQTAEIVGGMTPQIEAAASVPQSPPEVRQQILERRKTHPLGIAGALFEAEEAHPALELAGQALTQLIKQTLEKLQEGQRALIISHDGTMAAAEKIMMDEDFTEPLQQTYGELEGFIIDDRLLPQRLNV